MKPETRTGQPQVVTAAHAHPTTRSFLTTAAVLFIITAIEFGIVYIEGIRSTIVAVLFVLSIVKFYLVATVFMHLKFDSRILGWVFAVGVVLATMITLALKLVNLA